MKDLFKKADLLNKAEELSKSDIFSKAEALSKSDIFNKVDDIVDKIKSNKTLLEKFEKDPVSALESIIGIDLPNDQIEKLIDAVKAKLTVDDIGDVIGGLGKLLGKK